MKVARIQRRALSQTTKELPGAVNTVSVSTLDASGILKEITRAGSYSLGDGAVSLRVANDGKTIGHLKREVVSIVSKLFHFSISPQVAKKFEPNAAKAFKYSHLDLTMQKMSDAKDGLLAELLGLIPMSKETVGLIRSLK